MKKTLAILMAVLLVFGFASCDKPQPDDTKTPENEKPVDPDTGENENGGNNENDESKPQKFDFPFIAEYPVECGNLLAEGTEVGVTIEVTKVEDQNFVFELQ